MTTPIRPVDDAARSTAATLLDTARTAALGVTRDDGVPFVTRIAFGRASTGQPLTLISSLSAHTQALSANPLCSLLIGEPGARGDPLTHPRLTLVATAAMVPHGSAGYDDLAAHYLRHQPKAKLYIGFADFAFALFTVYEAHLNAGFGKAYRLDPADLSLPEPS